jgi:hypothetical protein
VNLSKLDDKHGLRRSLVALTVCSTFETTFLKALNTDGYGFPGVPAHDFALAVLVLPLLAEGATENHSMASLQDKQQSQRYWRRPFFVTGRSYMFRVLFPRAVSPQTVHWS